MTSRALPAVVLVALTPLAVLPGAFGPFHVAKWLVVLVSIPIGLAMCAATGRLRWPHRNWFLGWIAVTTIASIVGVSPWMSIPGSPNRNAGLLSVLIAVGAFILGASTGPDPSSQRIVLRAAFLSGGLVGLLAIAERLGFDIIVSTSSARSGSTWGSPTFLGAHMVLVLPIAIAHLKSASPRWRAAAWACSALMGAALVLSGTRGAWVAALVAAAVMLTTVRAGTQHHSSRRAERPTAGPPKARTAALVLAGVACVGAVAVLVMPNIDRASGVGRIDQWRTAVPVITDRPILGSGLDTQRVVLPSGIDASFERAHGSEELHDRVHNVVLDTLVTTGFIGLIALGALVFVLGRDIARSCRREVVPTAIAAGLLGYLVTLMFAFSDPTIDPIAWLLAGLVITASTSSAGTGEASDEQTSGATGSGSPRSPGRAARVLSASAFCLLGVLGALWAGGEVRAEYILDDAMAHQATPAGSPAPEVAEVTDRLQSAAATAPARFDLDQIAVRLVTQAVTEGDPDVNVAGDAFGWIDRALRVAGDDPDALMDKAELLTATDHADAALRLYERILELYPQSFRAHLGQGLAFAQSGDTAGAQRAWVTAADLGPDDARALINLGILNEDSGDPDRALDYFERALVISPGDPAAQAGIARVTPNAN